MIFHYCQRTTASGDCRLRPAGPNGVGLEMGYLVRLQGFTSQNETRRSNSLMPLFIHPQISAVESSSGKPYDSGGSIPDSPNPFLFGTVRATKQHPMLIFHAVTENVTSAVIAGWSELMNRAFETVKDVSRSGKSDLKRLVILITADFTGRHV